jgi:hypothetical protein
MKAFGFMVKGLRVSGFQDFRVSGFLVFRIYRLGGIGRGLCCTRHEALVRHIYLILKQCALRWLGFRV